MEWVIFGVNYAFSLGNFLSARMLKSLFSCTMVLLR
jgi:hypothetical protein